MEEHSKRSRSEDVEAHHRPRPGFQEEPVSPDEHGKRNLNDDDAGDDVQAHHRPRPGFQEEPGSPDEHGKRN